MPADMFDIVYFSFYIHTKRNAVNVKNVDISAWPPLIGPRIARNTIWFLLMQLHKT